MAGRAGSPGGLSMPGSPLDVGNFFSDLMHTPSRERSPSMLDYGEGTRAVLVKDESSAEVGGSGESGLPQLKEEPELEAVMGDMCDEDRGGSAAGRDDQQPQTTGDVVVLPCGANFQDEKLLSVLPSSCLPSCSHLCELSCLCCAPSPQLVGIFLFSYWW